ncbi:MAG TPA: ABC transporter ATP-binding protein [Bryobacterales bacterium]|nr:ABC transporter ATP-binding protein [Bryobacterales bacterium]
MSHIIDIADLRKTYHLGHVDVPALRGVSLAVEPGDFVAIVGPSGSGKSTLFHIIGGLTPPSSGHVRIDGLDLAAISDAARTRMRQRMVGFVFQKFNLLPTLTAAENIDIARDIASNRDFDRAHFDEIIRLLGIGGRLHHKPFALSGGEQQRVAIARALANSPKILLADEPTGNLDTENSQNVLGILKDLNRRLGQTTLMITHNPDAAAFCAHRIVHMRDGRLVDA